MNYEVLRHLSDSFGLLFLAFTFLGFVGWTFRPGSRQKHEEAAHMIFEEDQDDG